MRTLPHGIPRACPTTLLTIWGIWVEDTTVIFPFSILAKQIWFSIWQCWTMGVSYHWSILIKPGSLIASSIFPFLMLEWPRMLLLYFSWSWGAPSSIASWTSRTKGYSSYSTFNALIACLAAISLSAITAATSSPQKRTRSVKSRRSATSWWLVSVDHGWPAVGK